VFDEDTKSLFTPIAQFLQQRAVEGKHPYKKSKEQEANWKLNFGEEPMEVSNAIQYFQILSLTLKAKKIQDQAKAWLAENVYDKEDLDILNMTDEETGNNLMHITGCAYSDDFVKLTKDKTQPAMNTELKRMLR